MDLFGIKALSRKVDTLISMQANLMHLVKVLAREKGLVIEIFDQGKMGTYVYFVRAEEGNVINTEVVRPPCRDPL